MSDETQPALSAVEQRFEDASAAYYDNADYQAESSPTKCRAFIAACVRLVQLTPQASEHGTANERASFDVRLLSEQQGTAQRWLSTTGRAIEARQRRKSSTFRALDTSQMFYR